MIKQSTKENKTSSNLWLTVSIVTTIAGGVVYLLLMSMTDVYDTLQTLGNVRAWSPLVLLILAIFTVVSIIAITKTREWYKLIPAFLVLVNIAILALTLLAYALSGPV
ncbi:hypothetical protein H7X68_02110 [Candidatus Saccharibacteria bacterium]|nr:hypothetical protein [Candidatus Saccharibacteria bacterium]